MGEGGVDARHHPEGVGALTALGPRDQKLQRLDLGLGVGAELAEQRLEVDVELAGLPQRLREPGLPRRDVHRHLGTEGYGGGAEGDPIATAERA